MSEQWTPLAGKAAVVTGGASGIGLAIARAYADAGAHGSVLDLREPAAGALPEGWTFVAVDVRDDVSVASAIAQAASALGQIDVLALAAGIVPPWRGLTGFDAAEWDDVMRVNVSGVASSLAHALPHLRDGAAVVAVASLNSWRGDPNIPAYVASKHAVLGIVRSAALEIGRRGIRVNAIAPGPTLTGLTRASYADPEMRRATIAQIPLGRLGEPEDIVGAILFLASDESRWVTGSTVTVDGGYLVI